MEFVLLRTSQTDVNKNAFTFRSFNSQMNKIQDNQSKAAQLLALPARDSGVCRLIPQDGSMYLLQNSYVYYKLYLIEVLKSCLTSKKKKKYTSKILDVGSMYRDLTTVYTNDNWFVILLSHVYFRDWVTKIWHFSSLKLANSAQLRTRM